jgi:hypothetical protein
LAAGAPRDILRGVVREGFTEPMLPVVALSLALAPGADPVGPDKYPPVYIPTEAPFGYLYAPARDVTPAVRLPATDYRPKPGDVFLMSDTNRFWTFLYRLALTGRPGHGGVVVTMPNGHLGVLEAGYNGTLWTRLTPLDYKLHAYPGTLWVRELLVPLAPEQDARLTAFAAAAADKRYAVGKFLFMPTQFTPRGPLRTSHFGRPSGLGRRYTCAELILEALTHAGLLDGRTTRPAATYPQDLFYDRSRNPYIDRHPPLAGRGWGGPQLWTPIPGTALRGSDRPQPPAPWPGAGGAHVVTPIPTGGPQPPAPTVTEYVPGQHDPGAPVQSTQARIGFFDRPYRLLSRRR